MHKVCVGISKLTPIHLTVNLSLFINQCLYLWALWGNLTALHLNVKIIIEKRRFVAVLCLLSYKLKIAWRLHCKHWGNFVVPAGRYDLSFSSVNIVKARNSHDPVEFDFIIYSHNLFISLNVEELHFYLNKKWVFNSVFGWGCGYIVVVLYSPDSGHINFYFLSYIFFFNCLLVFSLFCRDVRWKFLNGDFAILEKRFIRLQLFYLHFCHT